MLIDSLERIKDMARGAVFLGSGGGGDPYIGQLMLQKAFQQGRRPQLVKAAELEDTARVVCVAGIGAPPVLVEHLLSDTLFSDLLNRMEDHLGHDIDALISAEIGGLNSMMPLAVGAQNRLPVIDADGMGRAFPHLEMVTFSVYGCRATPAIIINELGDSAIVNTGSDATAEKMCRAITASLGAMAYMALYPMSGRQVKDYAVHDTVSLCLSIGRCIRKARGQLDDPFTGILSELDQPAQGRYCRLLFDGKIVNVTHEIKEGWHVGTVELESHGGSSDTMVIDIQNEYLVARRNGNTVAIVPDLICTLDSESAEPLTAEMLKYGQRIKVVGLSAAPIMRRPECLQVFGPHAFGYKEPFQPLEAINP